MADELLVPPAVFWPYRLDRYYFPGTGLFGNDDHGDYTYDGSNPDGKYCDSNPN